MRQPWVCSIDQYDTNTVSAIVDCLGSACVGNECLSQILFQIACKCPDKLKLWLCELKQVKSFDELGCVFGQAMENAANAINNPSSAPKNCTGDPLLELIQVALDTTILGWYRCDEQGCPDGAVSDVYTDFGLENLQNNNLLSQSLLCNLQKCLTSAAKLIAGTSTDNPYSLNTQLAPPYQSVVSSATWCGVVASCTKTVGDVVAQCLAKMIIDNCSTQDVPSITSSLIDDICKCGSQNVNASQQKGRGDSDSSLASILATIIRCGPKQKPCCDWDTIIRQLAQKLYDDLKAEQVASTISVEASTNNLGTVHRAQLVFLSASVVFSNNGGALTPRVDPCQQLAGCLTRIFQTWLQRGDYDVLATLFCSQPALVGVLASLLTNVDHLLGLGTSLAMTFCNPACPYPTFDCNQDWVHTTAGGYVLAGALTHLIETNNFDKAVEFMGQILACYDDGCTDLARAIAFAFPVAALTSNMVDTTMLALELVRQNFEDILNCVVCKVFAFLRCVPTIGENGLVAYLGCLIATTCTATYGSGLDNSAYPTYPLLVVDLFALTRAVVQALCSCAPDQSGLLVSALESAVSVTVAAGGSEFDVVSCFEQLIA